MDFYIHTANQISSNHLPCPYRAPKKGPFPVSSQTSFFPKIRILNPLLHLAVLQGDCQSAGDAPPAMRSSDHCGIASGNKKVNTSIGEIRLTVA